MSECDVGIRNTANIRSGFVEVSQIYVEVFSFERQIARDCVFETAADSPTEATCRIARGTYIAGGSTKRTKSVRCFNLPPCSTASCVQQQSTIKRRCPRGGDAPGAERC